MKTVLLVLTMLVLLAGCASDQPAASAGRPSFQYFLIKSIEAPEKLAFVRRIGAELVAAGIDFKIADSEVDPMTTGISVDVSFQESDAQAIVSFTLIYPDHDQRSVTYAHHGRLTTPVVQRFARDVIALMRN